MPKLSRTERERIILEHVKGNPTPGWEVIEKPNGKYLVKEKKIEIEEEEEEEEIDEVEEVEETIAIQSQKQNSNDQSTREHPKQNAKELLRQLSELLAADEPEPSSNDSLNVSTYQQPTHPIANINWTRRKLRL